MSFPIVYTDDGGGGTGTGLAAAALNTAVPAQGYLLAGGLPATSGTLALSQPATQAIVNSGTQAVYLDLLATAVPSSGNLPTNSDCYVDLDSTGVYHVNSVVTGSAAPAISPAGSLRLYKATTSGSAVTAVAQLATPYPVSQGMVSPDLVEAATNDTLSVAGSTTQSNLNRVRYALQQLTGASQATMASILGAVTQMLPLAQKGSAGGVATLDIGGHVPLSELAGLTGAQLAVSSPTSGEVGGLTTTNLAGSGTTGGAGGTSGLATLDANKHVVQDPASKDQANGVPSLDGGALLSIAEARGVRKVVLSANTTNTPNLNSTSFSTFPWTFSNGFQIATHGGSIRCRLSTTGLGTGGTLTMSFQVSINGVTYALGSVYLAAVGPTYSHSFVIETPTLPANTYTATLEYMISSSVNVSAPVGGIVLELEEIA